jgi:4-hydroxy-tetrahydrodipicolinate reductase
MRCVAVGLGEIGREIARLAADHPALELKGAVDLDPSRVGEDLGELLGRGRMGLAVRDSLAAVLDEVRPEIVLHATGSFLEKVAPQIRACLEHGSSVVSTCEELSYPFYRHPKRALELHDLGVRHGAFVLGTGVNPGFVMDKLVATLISACTRVDRVRAVRVLDPATRRRAFQVKVGVGLSREEFDSRAATGEMGHVGLAESAHLLADVIGVSTTRETRESFEPRIAEAPRRSGELSVAPGHVLGIGQSVTITQEGRERVRLEVEMVVGAEKPGDTVYVEGSPSLEMAVPGGVPGDEATAAVTLNCALRAGELAPGLRTVLDVPLRFDPGSKNTGRTA